MEITKAIKYYIEENGLDKVPEPQFYFFLSDLCKDEIKPYRFILRFSDFSKMYEDLLKTPGAYVDIKQISYKWSQITGFREDLITELLRYLSKGVRKTIDNSLPEEKRFPLIILFNKYHHSDTKYLDFLKKGEIISNIITVLKLNAENKAYENKIRKSKYRLRHYLAEKEKQDIENARIAAEEARVAEEQERKKEARKQARLEAKLKKEKEEKIQDAKREADEINRKLGKDTDFLVISILLSVLIFLFSIIFFNKLNLINHPYVKIFTYSVNSISDNSLILGLIYLTMIIGLFLALIFGLRYIGNLYYKTKYNIKLMKWKRNNPNHRATPYL